MKIKTLLLDNIKEFLWPIRREELRLFLPMALMMMCMLFNFGALRSVKDALIVSSIGAEAISFLKLWLVLPSSVIFTLCYVELSNILNFEKVFYLVIGVFLTFFLLFAYIIYPNQELYHPSEESIRTLALAYPNFQWFIKIVGKWSYAIMYIFSELWSVVVINLMFWQFANHIFDTEKAKRFYPILGMIGNLGLVIAGNVLVAYSNIDPEIEMLDFKSKSLLLQPIILAIVISGILAMALFAMVNKVLEDANFQKRFSRVKEETKTKLSLKDSVKLIMHSKYVGHIVILVLCYGLLINILEGPWKAKVRELYPDTVSYINFMGRFNIWMGISCVTFMVIGSNVLRRLSWLASALFTPAMISITGSGFFIFVIFADDIPFSKSTFDPLYAAVIVGALQNILSKSTKYSLFDSTKEMAYIPLSVELRTKGKATVEVIGMKFGKSLGAFAQSSVFMLFPATSFDSISIYLISIFVVFCILWFMNIFSLNKEYIKQLQCSRSNDKF